ncbi:MAG: hypothetical protein WCK71_02165, partial [bacterium]
PKTPPTDTPHKIEPVDVNVMDGKAAGSGDTLPDPIDQSIGGNKIVSVPEATPLIAPMVKEEDSGVINTGTISPDVIEASGDNESNDDMVENSDSGDVDNADNTENSESSSDDGTENAEADTSSSDATDKSAEDLEYEYNPHLGINTLVRRRTKADKPKVENKDTAPASGDTTIEEVRNDLLKRVDTLNEERGKIQASIEAMEKDKKKYTDDYNEDMAAIGDGIKAANEKLADYDKFIAQLESLK